METYVAAALMLAFFFCLGLSSARPSLTLSYKIRQTTCSAEKYKSHAISALNEQNREIAMTYALREKSAILESWRTE